MIRLLARLRRAGNDPFAYFAFLDRIGADTHADQTALPYKTHPHPAARLDALERLSDTRGDCLWRTDTTKLWARVD